MNRTSINARNWGSAVILSLSMLYNGYMLGLGLLKQVEKRAVHGAVSQR